MAESDGVILYAGAYDSVADAKEDFELIRTLHREKAIGEFEAAVFHKDARGDVKIIDTVSTMRSFGAKAGAITGAVVGLLFPATIVASAVAGSGIGALVGNFSTGLKRKDIKEIGEMLDEGEAGVLMTGFTTLEPGDTNRFMKRASKVMTKQIDTSAEDIERAVSEGSGN